MCIDVNMILSVEFTDFKVPSDFGLAVLVLCVKHILALSFSSGNS